MIIRGNVSFHTDDLLRKGYLRNTAQVALSKETNSSKERPLRIEARHILFVLRFHTFLVLETHMHIVLYIKNNSIFIIKGTRVIPSYWI